MTRLRKLLQGCLVGTGGMAGISGPVASGKTELLHVFGEEAAAAGAAVVHVSGQCAESAHPLAVVGQLFRHPAFTPAARERARRLLDEHAPVEPCDADVLPHGQVPTRVNQELLDLLRAVAEQRPLVVAVDDLQFVDAASLQSLIWFSSRLRTSRTLVLTAESDAPGDGLAAERPWRTPLLRQPHFTRLRLGPLSRQGTSEALAQLIGPELATHPAAASWHRLSGGNPLLLRALVEDYRSATPAAEPPAAWSPSPGPRDPAPVPGEEFGRAVETCVRRGGSRFREVARALAVLAPVRLDPAGMREMPWRLLDRPPSWFDETVAAMNACGVLGSGRYRHPVARDAVLDGTPPAERSALQLRAARLLQDRGEPPAAVAGMLVGAGQSQEWGLPVLLEAAREALRRDDPRFARTCLDLADESRRNEEQRVAVALVRGLVEFRTDPGAAFRRLRPLLPDLTRGRLSDRQSVALLRPLLWHGTGGEIGPVLRRLDPRSHTLDRKSATEYRSVCEWLRASRPELVDQTGPQPVPAPAGAAVEPPPMRVAGVLSRVLRVGAGPEDVHTAELVLQATPLDDTSFEPLLSALLVLIYADRCDLAVVRCQALLRESAERGVPAWQAVLSSAMAEIAVRQGDVRSAEQYARDALALMPAAGWGVTVGSPLSALLLATTATGRAADVDGVQVPELMFQTRFGAQYLYARGRQRLSQDLLHGALDDLQWCGRLLAEWGIDLPAHVPWRNEAVEVLLRLGRAEEARRLAVEQLALPSAEQPRTRGAALRSLAAASEPEQRQALLRQAVDLLEHAGDRWELARALADMSDVHRRSGQARRAGMVARQAQVLAEELGLAPLLRRLRAADSPPAPDTGGAGTEGTAEGSAPGCGVLSGSERQVAALAATGHSNREIAEKLYITVSTVEQHLTHAYRKLRVKGRAQLPLTLARPDRGALLGLGR